jgi:hypothetical protein
VITTANLATGKPIKASSYPDTVGPDLANDGDFHSSWNPDDGQTSGWLEVNLGREQPFNVLSLVEPVGHWDDYKESRIKSYKFERWAPFRLPSRRSRASRLAASASASSPATIRPTSQRLASTTSRPKIFSE